MASRIQRTLVGGGHFAVQVADFERHRRCLGKVKGKVGHPVKGIRRVLEQPHAIPDPTAILDAGGSHNEGGVGVIEHLLPMLGDILHGDGAQRHVLSVLVLACEPQGRLVLRLKREDGSR